MKKILLTFALMFIALIQAYPQGKNNVIPLLGEVAPTFTAQSTMGKIAFPQDYGTKWKILLAHPKDFTPVCSSELLELAQQQAEYDKLGVQLVVISTDLLNQHVAWVKELENIKYKDREPVKINFPLVADSNLVISNSYGLLQSSVSIAENIRAVFIIDPTNKIRAITFYPREVGRNMEEIKRTLMALQTVDENKNQVAPANWNPGDELMVPYLTQTEKDKLGNPDSDIKQLAWFMYFRKTN